MQATEHIGNRKSSSTNRFEEDYQGMEAVTEETIANNLNSYRLYVESCIKVLDLIVYFKEFTDGKNTLI